MKRKNEQNVEASKDTDLDIQEIDMDEAREVTGGSDSCASCAGCGGVCAGCAAPPPPLNQA